MRSLIIGLVVLLTPATAVAQFRPLQIPDLHREQDLIIDTIDPRLRGKRQLDPESRDPDAPGPTWREEEQREMDQKRGRERLQEDAERQRNQQKAQQDAERARREAERARREADRQRQGDCARIGACPTSGEDILQQIQRSRK